MTSANRWCRAFSSVPPIYMPGRRRTGSRPSSTSMSAAVEPASAPGPRAATLRGARPFGSAAPNRSLDDFVLEGDFKGLFILFHALRVVVARRIGFPDYAMDELKK